MVSGIAPELGHRASASASRTSHSFIHSFIPPTHPHSRRTDYRATGQEVIAVGCHDWVGIHIPAFTVVVVWCGGAGTDVLLALPDSFTIHPAFPVCAPPGPAPPTPPPPTHCPSATNWLLPALPRWSDWTLLILVCVSVVDYDGCGPFLQQTTLLVWACHYCWVT